MDESSKSYRSQGCHVLPLGRRLAYSVGHVLNDLCASMWFSYLLIYQHSVLKFSNKIAGGLLLLGQVADALSTPFVGLESDRQDNFWLCRYGRRKTWHLVGSICVVCSFPFLFIECVGCSKSSQYAQFVYYAAFIAIFQFGWAATQISHLSLISDLTPISSERVELTAFRNAMTVMSNICVYSSMWAALGISEVKEDHISHADSAVFKNLALAMTGTGAFFSLIFHVFVKEPSHQEFHSTSQCSIQAGDHIDTRPHLRWKDWFKQPQFYQIAVLYMASRLYVNLSQVYMPLYIQDSLGLSKDKIAIIPLVIYVSGFLASFLMKMLNKVLGNKVTYLLGCLLAIAACVWILFGYGYTYCTYEIYAVAVLVGVATSTLLIISLSITSDLIGNSVSSGAFVFGAMSFVDKLSNGLAIVLIQDLHPCIACCSHCKWYYQQILVFACGGAVVFGLLVLSILSTQTIGVRKEYGSPTGSQHPNGVVHCSTDRSDSGEDDDDDAPLLPK